MRAYCKEQILNKFYSIDLSTGSGTPISLVDVKDYLRVTFVDDDASLTLLIKQAIQSIEKYCAISIYTRTVTVTADIVHEFELPYGPVISFTSAALKSDLTTYTAIASPNVDTAGQFARYIPDILGRLKLIYQAGNYLPDSLVLAVLNEVAFRYENKGDSVNRYAAQDVGISEGAEALSAPYRRLQWL